MRKQVRTLLTTAGLCSLLWTARVAPAQGGPRHPKAPPVPIVLEVGTLNSSQPLALDPELTRASYAPGELAITSSIQWPRAK